MVSTVGNPSELRAHAEGVARDLPGSAARRIVDPVTQWLSPSRSVRPASRSARSVSRSVRPAGGSIFWAVTATRRLLRALPASLLAILLVFHGWLLYASISSGRVLDVDVAMRWLAGLLLSGAFVAFWRLGVPLVRGRKAVVLWALVVVLHAHAVASAPASLVDDTPTTQTVVSLAAQLVGPLTAFFGVVLLAFGVRSVRPGATRRLVLVLTSDTLAHTRTSGVLIAAPRPPPALA